MVFKNVRVFRDTVIVDGVAYVRKESSTDIELSFGNISVTDYKEGYCCLNLNTDAIRQVTLADKVQLTASVAKKNYGWRRRYPYLILRTFKDGEEEFCEDIAMSREEYECLYEILSKAYPGDDWLDYLGFIEYCIVDELNNREVWYYFSDKTIHKLVRKAIVEDDSIYDDNCGYDTKLALSYIREYIERMTDA